MQQTASHKRLARRTQYRVVHVASSDTVAMSKNNAFTAPTQPPGIESSTVCRAKPSAREAHGETKVSATTRRRVPLDTVHHESTRAAPSRRDNVSVAELEQQAAANINTMNSFMQSPSPNASGSYADQTTTSSPASNRSDQQTRGKTSSSVSTPPSSLDATLRYYQQVIGTKHDNATVAMMMGAAKSNASGGSVSASPANDSPVQQHLLPQHLLRAHTGVSSTNARATSDALLSSTGSPSANTAGVMAAAHSSGAPIPPQAMVSSMHVPSGGNVSHYGAHYGDTDNEYYNRYHRHIVHYGTAHHSAGAGSVIGTPASGVGGQSLGVLSGQKSREFIDEVEKRLVPVFEKKLERIEQKYDALLREVRTGQAQSTQRASAIAVSREHGDSGDETSCPPSIFCSAVDYGDTDASDAAPQQDDAWTMHPSDSAPFQYDVRANCNFTVYAGRQFVLKTANFVQLPRGYYAFVLPNQLTHKQFSANRIAVVPFVMAPYTNGASSIKFYNNHPKRDYTVRAGEVIATMMIARAVPSTLHHLSPLSLQQRIALSEERVSSETCHKALAKYSATKNNGVGRPLDPYIDGIECNVHQCVHAHVDTTVAAALPATNTASLGVASGKSQIQASDGEVASVGSATVAVDSLPIEHTYAHVARAGKRDDEKTSRSDNDPSTGVSRQGTESPAEYWSHYRSDLSTDSSVHSLSEHGVADEQSRATSSKSSGDADKRGRKSQAKVTSARHKRNERAQRETDANDNDEREKASKKQDGTKQKVDEKSEFLKKSWAEYSDDEPQDTPKVVTGAHKKLSQKKTKKVRGQDDEQVLNSATYTRAVVATKPPRRVTRASDDH